MSDEMTTGQALDRLEESLSATNVLSKDYRSHILAWAYKAVELADKAARDKVRSQLLEDAQSAGEASWQAAFWRARAIELGAAENEYRQTLPATANPLSDNHPYADDFIEPEDR